MKILLIGHSIIDHIETSGAALPGGIYYSALGISSLEKEKKNISILTGRNKKSFHLFEKLFAQIDLSPSEEISEMPEVFLDTSSAGERKEKYFNLSAGLSLKNISDWNSYDGILINMITGFDISLDQIKFIRKNYGGTIHFDIHSLSRGVDENMKRDFRPVPHIKEWLANIDIFQCNEAELLTVIQNKNEFEIAEEILDAGVKMVILTRGENGATLFHKTDSEISVNSVRAEKINCSNKIGCGDIFGAVFFYSYISKCDPLESLAKANHAGAVAASLNEFNSDFLKGLKVG